MSMNLKQHKGLIMCFVLLQIYRFKFTYMYYKVTVEIRKNRNQPT